MSERQHHHYEDLFPGDTTHYDDHPLHSDQSPEIQLRNSMLGDPEVTGQAYAWGKTARIICEPHYQRALKNTDGTFIAVDLCSAYPWFAQILRESHLQECYHASFQLIGNCIAALQSNSRKLPPELQFPTFNRLNDEQRRQLRDTISPRNGRLRRMLQAVVQETLHSPPQIDTAHELPSSTAQLAWHFLHGFHTTKIEYYRRFEMDELVGKGRWEIILARSQVQTPHDRIAVIIGDQKAHEFLKDLARSVSTQCLPLLRKRIITSYDIADPADLIREATTSFPARVRDTNFFFRAGRLEDKHLRGDILALPFTPDSVSCFTCIEGYPYYFFDLLPQNHLAFAQSIAESLQPGGCAEFFPWHMRPDRESNQEMLRKVENFWLSRGMELTLKTYAMNELIMQMGDRETLLTMHSPVFGDHSRDTLDALIVEKPVRNP